LQTNDFIVPTFRSFFLAFTSFIFIVDVSVNVFRFQELWIIRFQELWIIRLLREVQKLRFQERRISFQEVATRQPPLSLAVAVAFCRIKAAREAYAAAAASAASAAAASHRVDRRRPLPPRTKAVAPIHHSLQQRLEGLQRSRRVRC
jgi:hypothetical protein